MCWYEAAIAVQAFMQAWDAAGEFLVVPDWEKRKCNREWSTNHLREQGIPFQVKNKGAHLVVGTAGRYIDFWPGTGLWIDRETQTKARGVRRLVRFWQGPQAA